jgi:hypothetical protein
MISKKNPAGITMTLVALLCGLKKVLVYMFDRTKVRAIRVGG